MRWVEGLGETGIEPLPSHVMNGIYASSGMYVQSQSVMAMDILERMCLHTFAKCNGFKVDPA